MTIGAPIGVTPNVPRWSPDELGQRAVTPAAVVADPVVAARAAVALRWPFYSAFADLPADTATLVVVGGGALIDAAKVFRADERPAMRLVAIASLWGSGAEASGIAVVRDGERKIPRVEPGLLPDARVVLPTMADGMPTELARMGCGDAWSHVLEGSLSPLANPTLQAAGAALIGDMLATGLGVDPAWFDLSARACELQAASSVGLVHGIAHVLEGPLQAADPTGGWGHARLCSLFLWPVWRLNTLLNSKWPDFVAGYDLGGAAVEATLRDLYDDDAFSRALPTLIERWKQVLREPLSRTNSALVRRSHLDHFTERRFL